MSDSALAKGLGKAEARLKAFGGAVQAVGQSFLKLGVVTATPFVAGGKAFADFESAMARVKAITNASEGDFARLGGKAKQLGRDTVFSATAAAQAMGNFAQAGFKVDEILTAVGPTLDLAATAQIGIAESADIAIKVLRGMGLEVGQLSSVVDVLAKAATTSNTDITMLGEAFKFVGPIAKTAGVGLDEITAAIQLLSNAGIQGETAGTTLRGMVLSLTSPSAEATKTLAELGVRVNDAKGDFRGITAVVADLEKSLASLGSGAKLEKLGTIFPARSAAGAAELVAQGAAKLRDATKALGGSGGTAGRIAATQLDTVKGAATLLLSSLELVGAEVGQSLNPLIRKWGAVLTDAANALALVIGRNQGFVAGLAKGVVAVAGAGAALVAVGAAAKLAAFAFGAAGAVLNAVTAAAALTNTAFRLLTVTINLASVATAAFSSLGAVLAAVTSPAALVAAALAGVAYWLTQTESGGQALASLGGLFKELSAVAVQAFGGIADALKAGDIAGAGKILWAALRVEWLTGVDYLKGVWAEWGTAATDIYTAFVALVTDTWGGLVSLVAAGWAGLASVFAPVTEMLGASWGGLVDYFTSSLDLTGVTFRGFTRELAGTFVDLTAYLRGVWAGAMADLFGSWGSLLERIVKSLVPFAGAIAEFFGIDIQKTIDDALGSLGVGGGGAAESSKRARGKAEALAGIERDREAAQKALDDQKEAADAEARKGARSGPSADLEKAKKDLQAALDAAKPKPGAGKTPAELMKARIDAKLGALPGEAPGGGAGDKEGLTPEGLDDAMERASAKIDVKGTFQASAARGLSAGDSVREQVDEQKKTNQKLDKIDERLRKTGAPVASEP